MNWRMTLSLIFLSLLGVGPLQAESIQERFERGKLEFGHKNFANAIESLQPLLHPTVQLSAEDRIVKAREMLGLCYFYTGQEQLAGQEFTALLYLRPRHRLDDFLIPPPAIAFFDRVWNEPEMKEKLEKIERERSEARQKQQKPLPSQLKKIYLQREEIHRSRTLAFLPFGLGQFQNGETGKGIILATGGGLSLTANMVCYGLLSALANENGTYPAADLELARGLRVGQYLSLGLFVAAWIYGAVDANLYFHSVSTGPYRIQKQEQIPLLPDSAAWVPFATPGGGGFSFRSRF